MHKFPTKPPPLMLHSPTLQPRPILASHQLDSYQLPMADALTPAWLAMLRRVKFPLDVIVLDFESYFDPDYRMGSAGNALSTIEYVMDERFEIVGLGRLIMPGAAPFSDYQQRTYFAVGAEAVAHDLQWLQTQYGENLEQTTVVIQNAQFDATILSRHFNIHPPHVIDILGLARHWNARAKNDLQTLTERWKLPPKGDTAAFAGVTLRQRWMRVGKSKAPVARPLATGEQLTALAAYGANDVMREWELFTLLLPRLSNPATELRLMQHTLELFTKPTIAVDRNKGADLILQMELEIDRAVRRVSDYLGRPATRAGISGTKSFERDLVMALQNAGDDPQKYFKYGKLGPILAIAKADDERNILLKHPDPAVRALMEARVAIKSWPLHIGRVSRILRQARAAGGLIPVPLKYHGAHTGRYAGGEKINLQNLPVR